MLSDHVMSLLEKSDSDDLLLADPVSEETDDEELFVKVLYRASFEELGKSHVQYDTTIWVLVSLLLVLAWGVGVLMLLYLPFRRYVLQKEISSSTLYVTQKKVCKVIITEAAKNIRGVRSLKPASFFGEGLSTATMRPLTEIPSLGRLQSPRGKVRASSRHVLYNSGGIIPGDIVLHKLEKVSQSVKEIESLVVGRLLRWYFPLLLFFAHTMYEHGDSKALFSVCLYATVILRGRELYCMWT